MAVKQKERLTRENILFGTLMLNRLLFTMGLWKGDLTIPEDRYDLPEDWRGKQKLTLEQRRMILDMSRRMIFCTSRKVAKSLILESRFFHWPIESGRTEVGHDEGLLFTPMEHHLRPLANRMRSRMEGTPILKLMCDAFNMSQMFAKFPNFMWYMRVQGNSGTGQNFVGLRANFSMGDEMAFFKPGGWTDLQNTFMPNAPRIYAGVPNGDRSTNFYKLSTSRLGRAFSIHGTTIWANPLYHSMAATIDEARKHGGTKTQGFITQCLGEWGAEAEATFPIIPVTDAFPYNVRHITGEQITKMGLKNLITFEIAESEGWEDFIISGDMGLTGAPTILGIWGIKHGAMVERARINLTVTTSRKNAMLIDYVNIHVLPRRAVLLPLDSHGIGEGTVSVLREDPAFLARDNYVEKVWDTGFGDQLRDESEAIHKDCNTRMRKLRDSPGWYCDKCRIAVYDDKDFRFATVQAKQVYTEALKEAFDNGQNWMDAGMPDTARFMPRIVLAEDDEDLQIELGGTTEVKTPTGALRYVTVEGVEHLTDMVRAAIAGTRSKKSIEDGPMEANFNEFGWGGSLIQDGVTNLTRGSAWEVI